MKMFIWKDFLMNLFLKLNNWDMAMYLTYFHATLYEDGRVLGEVEYDAKMGGANFAKFGRTAEKIRPLLSELLQKADRSNNAPAFGQE